jgi:predicted XRE-type DNA-binding protein
MLARGRPRNKKHFRTKKKLARAIKGLLAGEGISQRDAARILKLTQPKISAISNGKVGGFSMEKLMEILTALDVDVEIVIKKKNSSAAAKIHITAA